MEEWIKIDDRYSVSSFGNVRNDKTGRILKLYKNSKGYLQFTLNRVPTKVHRLMIPFLENPNNYECVDHIDRNKQNNHVSNLRMVSPSENIRNRTKYKNKISKYKGVDFNKASQHWRARCSINGKSIWIGTFENEIDAGLAYNNFCIQNKLETAVLNEL